MVEFEGSSSGKLRLQDCHIWATLSQYCSFELLLLNSSTSNNHVAHSLSSLQIDKAEIDSCRSGKIEEGEISSQHS
jgi:hypothetical protein